jgi:gliding motility-associated lipoprotein GldH
MIQYTKSLFFCVTIICVTCLLGCQTIDLYEKHIPIPGHDWKRSSPLEAQFEIKDTSASYQLFIVIRHTDAYKYNNIWLNVGLQSPGDSMYMQKLNVSLGDDAQGWYGSGMNDIWEVRKPLTDRPRRFVRAGTYKYSISQIMRDNPLKHVMGVGIRVEKMD